MIKNSIVQSFGPDNCIGIGLITREDVRGRAHELALMAGRFSWQVMHADYEQAERELKADSDRVRQEAMLDATLQAKGREPLPGLAGPGQRNSD